MDQKFKHGHPRLHSGFGVSLGYMRLFQNKRRRIREHKSPTSTVPGGWREFGLSVSERNWQSLDSLGVLRAVPGARSLRAGLAGSSSFDLMAELTLLEHWFSTCMGRDYFGS